ncbi:MAG: hypothetical protein KDK34_16995, partial [Leptospiraceae bacterium]|nr:hypothetical protein [Leptospiraceae bacterium]
TYKENLIAEINGQDEAWVLYRRDIFSLIDRNEVFVSRVSEIEELDFDFNGAATIDGLADLINSFENKYSDHRRELLNIVYKQRDLPDDAAKLAAIKSDIADWFTKNTQNNAENIRLHEQVTKYFNEGLGGYYLTGNESDPYLMTRVEYEWELLRRERNYLAKRLERAEAIKRYADLAKTHEAGLEMASITRQRTEIAEFRRDIRELYYQLIKGDIDLDPAVYSNAAVRDSEFNRLLSERELDPAQIYAQEDALIAEQSILSDVMSYGNPSAGDLAGLRADIDAYLTAYVSEEDRTDHRMNVLRDKLLTHETDVLNGTDPGVLANRWSVLTGTATALAGEISTLINDYDFNGLRDELDALRLAVEEKSIPGFQADLTDIRAQLEANADLLADAKVELDEARLEYREARIDYDVLRANNADDLLRIDILNNTEKLAAILNRMNEIESIPGFENTTQDAITQARLEYMYEVSENQRAVDDLRYSEAAYDHVKGLEESKNRTAKLNEILATPAFTSLDPSDKAALFTNPLNAVDLIDEVSSEESYRSAQSVLDAYNSLKAAELNYNDFDAQLTQAIA